MASSSLRYSPSLEAPCKLPPRALISYWSRAWSQVLVLEVSNVPVVHEATVTDRWFRPALTGITPVLVSEVSSAEHRGGFLGYVFIANYLGISIAYWLDFGLSFVDGGHSAVRWRFLLAFQCLPALLLLAGIRMLPDSPRYLASVGRTEEAREVLEHVRGRYDAAVEQEFNEIVAVAKENNKSGSPIEFIRIILGLDKSKGAHFGRRAWLCIWLQIMASWTGITAVTAYSPVLLSQAGYSAIKQNGLAGGLNTIGIVGTIISAQIVDRYGRRQCLMWGAAGLSTVNLIVSPISLVM